MNYGQFLVPPSPIPTAQQSQDQQSTLPPRPVPPVQRSINQSCQKQKANHQEDDPKKHIAPVPIRQQKTRNIHLLHQVHHILQLHLIQDKVISKRLKNCGWKNRTIDILVTSLNPSGKIWRSKVSGTHLLLMFTKSLTLVFQEKIFAEQERDWKAPIWFASSY